mmetsp:Transcript_43597/g.87241  ORF Transcript_43597/g.87241 Transcript_43597/m.87241 type:complete len:81 (+) Transcript_43597:137-379(+)
MSTFHVHCATPQLEREGSAEGETRVRKKWVGRGESSTPEGEREVVSGGYVAYRQVLPPLALSLSLTCRTTAVQIIVHAYL